MKLLFSPLSLSLPLSVLLRLLFSMSACIVPRYRVIWVKDIVQKFPKQPTAKHLQVLWCEQHNREFSYNKECECTTELCWYFYATTKNCYAASAFPPPSPTTKKQTDRQKVWKKVAWMVRGGVVTKCTENCISNVKTVADISHNFVIFYSKHTASSTHRLWESELSEQM